MSRRVLLALALAYLAACMVSAADPYRGSVDAPGQPTLLVTNDTGQPVRVYLRGEPIGHARPGDTCFRLHTAPLVPVSVGFRFQRTVVESPRERFRDGEGWRIRIGADPERDVKRLVPARRPCK